MQKFRDFQLHTEIQVSLIFQYIFSDIHNKFSETNELKILYSTYILRDKQNENHKKIEGLCSIMKFI